MGNTLSYLHSFTQCIRTRRRHFKRKTSQQLMDVNPQNNYNNHTQQNCVNDGFLYDSDSDDDDEKVIFYKPEKMISTHTHTYAYP